MHLIIKLKQRRVTQTNKVAVVGKIDIFPGACTFLEFFVSKKYVGYTQVSCNHRPQLRGIAGTLTFRSLNPCYNPTLRG